MTCLLSIDYGTKHIGLAIGDDQTKIASPLSTITATGGIKDHVESVLKMADEYNVDAFVVGLPKNMDDTEGPQAQLSRRFGEELARISDKRVHYCDERLSSYAADELLEAADLTRKKKKSLRDAVAAQVILQSFLDTCADQSSI